MYILWTETAQEGLCEKISTANCVHVSEKLLQIEGYCNTIKAFGIIRLVVT